MTARNAPSFERKILFAEADADPEALTMNHYDAAVWAREAEAPRRVVVSFAAWLKSFCSVELVSKRTGKPYRVAKLAGFNLITFDEPRLRALFAGEFCPWSYQVRDVLQRALFYFDEHPELPAPENFKLGTLAAYFGLSVEGAHDALADARLTAELARALRTTQPMTVATAPVAALLTQDADLFTVDAVPEVKVDDDLPF
jgi:hypothetical protein